MEAASPPGSPPPASPSCKPPLLPANSRTSQLELTLILTETAEGLMGDLHYRTALFDSTTAGSLRDDLQTLLEAVAADPERRLDELPLQPPAARSQITFQRKARARPSFWSPGHPRQRPALLSAEIDPAGLDSKPIPW